MGGYVPPPSSGRVKRFTLNLDYASGAPSGFQRSMMVINNQFPAPVIEANQGDTLEITVNNHLEMGQSIHWHGMRQNHTNSEDGVAGVSQCSIPPGGSYTYRFHLESEYGTYWYHSHYANTYADGIAGALIVHAANDPLKKYTHFDDERIMYLSDWMNDQSETIVHGITDETIGYRGSALPPDPDALLINGIGQSDCSRAQAGVLCQTTTPSITKVVSGRNVRLRLLNTGAHAMIRYSIDNHVLRLVEVDDTPVQPVDVHEITVAPGQRYSVVVKMDKGKVGDSFWIRATMASACLNEFNIMTTKAILRYTDFLGLTWFGNGIPTTQPWADLHDPAKAPCIDTDQEHSLVPMVVEDSPSSVTTTGVMNSNFGRFVDAHNHAYIGFGYNNISFVNYINNPLYSQIQKGLQLDGGHVASVTFPEFGGADLIINNLDPDFLSHPYHLHGRPFHIVARGHGKISARDVPTLQLNLKNPIRRDTLVIPGNQYVVLRIITDTPGVWPLHCHIGWHLSVGKLGVVVIRPDEIAKQTNPAAWSAMCSGLDINVIGPAKRALPPQARHDLVEERYADGVRDFTPTPDGAVRGEYRSNGTHWWVVGFPGVEGTIPRQRQVAEKLNYLESRTVFKNATDWWIPGTVFHGKLVAEIEATISASNAGATNGTATGQDIGNVHIVGVNETVPGPGSRLAEPMAIVDGKIVDDTHKFTNSVPEGFSVDNKSPAGSYVGGKVA